MVAGLVLFAAVNTATVIHASQKRAINQETKIVQTVQKDNYQKEATKQEKARKWKEVAQVASAILIIAIMHRTLSVMEYISSSLEKKAKKLEERK